MIRWSLGEFAVNNHHCSTMYGANCFIQICARGSNSTANQRLWCPPFTCIYCSSKKLHICHLSKLLSPKIVIFYSFLHMYPKCEVNQDKHKFNICFH